ncbi:DNA (cytosine-5-)-methyltransferase [Candidatus Dojkabacteria bacterium]|jgi:DNA (cytosine-5)-methyltransferase 1|nr:DNA (cytosine-5-)-methyltransferase [Candidatus Dojkabacteria bacterium]
MKYFSTFSGIGGFELAVPSHWKCVGYSEIEKRAIEVYQKHFPNHKNYGDITKIKAEELPDFDALLGGFPCQAFSIAGNRKGFDDTRGTLFFDIARILKIKKSKFVLLENVKGLLSHDKGKTFKTIIKTLDELGYDVEWCVYNSTDFGRPQARPRVYIAGFIRGSKGQSMLSEGIKQKAPILFECKTRFRNTNYNWEEIGRVSTGIIRDYAGLSIRVDGRITEDGEEVIIG